MKATIFFTLAFAVPAFADYSSASQQIHWQRQIAAQKQAPIDADRRNSDLVREIEYIANHKHHGLAEAISITQVGESGTYALVGFKTKDGWECDARRWTLKCANVVLGREFRAENWQRHSPYLTLIIGQGFGFF
jgi:hypothetical protein